MAKNDSSFQINKRSLLTAAIIIFALIILSYCLTLFLPPGEYQRTVNDQGEEVVVPDSYQESTVEAGQYPVYNILLVIFKSFAPGGEVNLTMIVIMLFILLIGGSFTLLDKSGILRAVIARIAVKMYRRKYLLIAVISLVFMCFGSFFGILEEVLPLIPLVVGLSFMLGWDSLMGLGLSLLATSFGFAAAIYNPFSIVIAQNLAGVETYSGTWPRAVFFVVIYILLLLFLIRYAKKLDKNPMASRVYAEDSKLRDKYRMTPAQIEEAAKFRKAPMVFIGVLLGAMIIYLIVVSVLTSVLPEFGLADYSMVVIAVFFIVAATVGAKLAGFKGIAKTFFRGVLDIAPGIALIPMAMSVSTLIKDSGIQDTILFHCSTAISGTSPYVSILLIYAAVLILELFVAQASAKAFLLMPLLASLATLVGISGQSVVQAYVLGDGFLNVLYPTNAMLLIALGLTTVSYPKWFRFTIVLQLIVMVLSVGFLLLAVAGGYQ